LAHVGRVGEAVERLAAVLPHQLADGVDVDHRVPPGAQGVDRTAVGDGEEPAGEALLRVVPGGVPPDVEEGPLEHVLGLVGADVASQVGEHTRAVVGVGVLECRLVPSGEPDADALSAVHTSFFVRRWTKVAQNPKNPTQLVDIPSTRRQIPLDPAPVHGFSTSGCEVAPGGL